MTFSGKQVAAARELLGITQGELAAAAGIAWHTLQRFEAGTAALRRSSLEKIETELQKRGIEFTNGDGTGVRLNHRKAEEYARLTAASRNDSNR